VASYESLFFGQASLEVNLRRLFLLKTSNGASKENEQSILVRRLSKEKRG
jgi:hypothetical protein